MTCMCPKPPVHSNFVSGFPLANQASRPLLKCVGINREVAQCEGMRVPGRRLCFESRSDSGC